MGLRTAVGGRELVELGGVAITVGGVVGAALALLGAWLVSWLVRLALRRYGERGEGQRTSRATLYTLGRVVHYTALVVGGLVAVSLLGVPLNRFAVFAGAVGVGLGFGLQSIFSNFIAGLILLFDRSLKVGDFVELESGVHGEVRDIKIRATTIVTNDNIDILVPNSEFVGGRVVNWTHRDVSRRLRVPFGVAYGTDKETVREAALESAAEVPFTLTFEGVRRPQVWLTGFGDSALEFELVVWLNAEATVKPGAVRAAYNWSLHTSLQRRGIEIPFPQRDVNLRSLFGLTDAEALAALRLEVPPTTPRAGLDGEPSTRAAGPVESEVEAGVNDAVEDVRNDTADPPEPEDDRQDRF